MPYGGSNVDGRGTRPWEGLSRAWLLWETKATLGKHGFRDGGDDREKLETALNGTWGKQLS